ncbi:predicted transcriptional regulator [Vibrio variabilis]|uniref:Predicted transcriptional regulator n=1 Tax=Vibrio variabilis TaxID=990271 RepID=A0ABQ0JFU1_9VIBR|nr:predicted transcriptional regulator [Vibrio variabilis]
MNKKDRMSEDIYDEYPSLTLARESTDENIEPLKLGERIKDIRSKMGLTLEEASQRTGLARSTLSKIENEQISPTFQAMQKLASGLHIDMPQLFEPPKKKVATGVVTLPSVEKENRTLHRRMNTSFWQRNYQIRR